MYVKSLNMHVYLQLAEKKLSGCIFLPQSTMHKEVRVWQKVTVLWTKRSCMVNHNCYSLWYDRPGSLSEWALLLYTLRVTLQSAFQTAAAQVGRIKIYGDEGFSFFFFFFFLALLSFPVVDDCYFCCSLVHRSNIIPWWGLEDKENLPPMSTEEI